MHDFFQQDYNHVHGFNLILLSWNSTFCLLQLLLKLPPPSLPYCHALVFLRYMYKVNKQEVTLQAGKSHRVIHVTFLISLQQKKAAYTYIFRQKQIIYPSVSHVFKILDKYCIFNSLFTKFEYTRRTTIEC